MDTKDIATIIPATASALAAFFAASATCVQARTAKKQLRADLYKTRVKVYLATNDALNIIFYSDPSSDVSREAQLNFSHAANEAKFLFADNHEIARFLLQLKDDIKKICDAKPKNIEVVEDFITKSMVTLEEYVRPYLALK